MFRKEDICDVNKRKEWWNKNPHIVFEKLDKIVSCFVFDKYSVDDVVADVLRELDLRVWNNHEFKFHLEKIENMDKVNSFDAFFDLNVLLLLKYTFKNYKGAILKILRQYNVSVKNIDFIKKKLKTMMEESEYNYSENGFNNMQQVQFCNFEEVNENEIITDRTSESDKFIFTDTLCKAIDKLKDTSNNTILLAFFQQDNNLPVIEILTNVGKYKKIALEAELIKTKDTLYKMNSIFRICLILDIDKSFVIISMDERGVIKHAFLTKTKEENDLHRADNLYEVLSPTATKKMRKNGTQMLKDRFISNKGKFNSFLLNIYTKILSSYESRTIREGLRL